jgi:dTDP-4-dehydrorhamnose 3,5-epimerase
MRVIPTAIPAVRLVETDRHADERGHFTETYSRRAFAAAGIGMEFVQDNHSLSRRPGTVRGLHFQAPPFAQDKLVRVVRGAIFDVAVDVRRGSPSFRRHVAVILRADEPRQLLVPAGFAHGFCTLEPDTEVIYKVSGFYSPAHDRGIRWDDPDLGIAWPVAAGAATVSLKDRQLPALRDSDVPFEF